MPYSTLSQNPNFRFPEGMLDVRGFEVRTAEDNEKVGTVDDLVFSGNQPRYLDVDLAGLFNMKHVLLPIGWAQLDETRQIIWVPGITKEQFKRLPEYRGDLSEVTGDYETRIRAVGPSSLRSEQHYSHERFYRPREGTLAGGEREARVTRSEEELAVGKRPVEAGEAAIRKSVETERVRQPVSKLREEVEIERRPIDRMAAGEAQIGEEEVRVPIMEEEIVTEKRAVPKEEVIVKKRAVEETKDVEAELKKERIDVDERSRTRRGRDDEERMH